MSGRSGQPECVCVCMCVCVCVCVRVCMHLSTENDLLSHTHHTNAEENYVYFHIFPVHSNNHHFIASHPSGSHQVQI